jgi:hypothetical protein
MTRGCPRATLMHPDEFLRNYSKLYFDSFQLRFPRNNYDVL